MAIVVTDLGGAQTPGGFGSTNPSLTATVPAGSLIFVVTAEQGAVSAAGTISDDVVNVYTKDLSKAINNADANGWGACFHTYNCKPLIAQHIIYSRHASNTAAVMAAFYATGIATDHDPIDTTASNTAFGNSLTPSVTSGTPSWGEDLFVGTTAVNGNKTYAFTPLLWTAHPPDQVSDALSNVSVEGCYRVNTTGNSLTYDPSYTGGALNWTAFVVGFKSMASDFPTFSMQEALPYRRRVRLLGY